MEFIVLQRKFMQMRLQRIAVCGFNTSPQAKTTAILLHHVYRSDRVHCRCDVAVTAFGPAVFVR
jgi:hypothetical protein